ncbi:MAG: glycosyltransferase family 1 protein, partial [Patescibacteria group bacterium]
VPFESLAERGVRRPYLLHVGNTYPHKNLERLIAAVELTNRRRLDFQLVLVGKDDYFARRLRVEVQQRALRNVLFFGFASDQELAALYQHAQAYIFPSLSEGFGLPGLEAMQAGTPVFAARASCLPEVFADAAAYFDPLEPTAIAQSIERALRDTLLRQRLITAGRRRLTYFSWRRLAEQTLALYEKSSGHGPVST